MDNKGKKINKPIKIRLKFHQCEYHTGIYMRPKKNEKKNKLEIYCIGCSVTSATSEATVCMVFAFNPM